MTRKARINLITLAVSLGLLGAVAAESAARPKPANAEPFHRRIREAAANMPLVVGEWEGKDVEVAPAAVALLRPNVILQRRYAHRRTGRAFDFLLVQCRDARDMAGHYPPICYPAHGWTAGEMTEREWSIGDSTISGMKYEFHRVEQGKSSRCEVNNIIVMPNGRYALDIGEVRSAAADYVRQFYGAAQVQVVFDLNWPEEERRAAFAQIMQANLPVLATLGSGGRYEQ